MCMVVGFVEFHRRAAIRQETLNYKLFGAMNYQDPSKQERLLKLGADPNAALPYGEDDRPLENVSFLSKLQVFLGWKEEYGKCYFLMLAAGQTDEVKLLLKYGANVNAADPIGRTTLMYVARCDHPSQDAIKILLDNGADINAVDHQGKTALILATQLGHFNMVETLLKAQANAQYVSTDGETAISAARDHHFGSIVQLLQRYGCK
jgi:ankyrin repeat protein